MLLHAADVARNKKTSPLTDALGNLPSVSYTEAVVCEC